MTPEAQPRLTVAEYFGLEKSSEVRVVRWVGLDDGQRALFETRDPGHVPDLPAAGAELALGAPRDRVPGIGPAGGDR